MPKPKRKKTSLPRYVIQKGEDWFVRRSFRNGEIGLNGAPKYDQIQRACFPRTAEHAALVAAAIEAEYRDTAPPPVDLQTIDDFIAAFVSIKKGSIVTRTHDSYDWFYQKYIKGSAFSRLTATEVTPFDVQSFYTRLQAEDGVSAKMIRKIHNFLSMAFNKGVLWETMRRNPCKGLVLPKFIAPDIDIMDQDEARRFAQVCFADPELLVLAFALETGMRPGEYLSLQWKNVDLHHGVVKVVRSVTFPDGGGFYYGEPKTQKSKRSIEISEKLIEALRDHRKRQIAQIAELKKTIAAPLASSHGKNEGFRYEQRKLRRKVAREHLAALTEHNLVFPSKAGTPAAPHNLGIRNMKKACKAAKVDTHSLYSLRHTMATIALANGVNVKTVSEKLGHADVAITLNTYAHVLPIMKSGAVSVLAEALY